jgi:phage-related protein
MSKRLGFRGGALGDLRAFPPSARREAGYQLDKVQNGEPATDWKPMAMVGRGVQEIRIRDDAGAFRIIYIARFADLVYVLHCFQKKTQKTARSDLDIATKRYRELVKELAR